MNALLAPIRQLWRHRHLLVQTTRNDIRARYAGSLFGLAWTVLFPLLFLGCYALLYLFIFTVRLKLPDGYTASPLEFVVLVFCGLIPFIGVADALGTGVSSVSSNANLIKNTLFPIELVPVKAVLTGQVTQVVGMGMLLAAIGVTGRLTLWALMLPAVWVLQVAFMIGMIWVLSGLNVYIRDLQNIITVVILMLMMVSPIAWTAEMIPARLRPLMGINPLYYVILSYQEILFHGRFPRGSIFWGLVVLAVGSFWLGYGFFTRLKRAFADSV